MNATTVRRLLSLAALCGLVALLSPLQAQELVVEPIVDEPAPGSEVAAFSQAELDQLLAPVALYPDALLSQVLVAATYPLEIVEAARWSRDNPSLEGEAAVAAAADRDWDPSVKSLLAFPDLLGKMNEDLEWTRRLGEAMLLQESAVMDSIQFLRARAEENGTLEDTEHVRVVREERTIVIEPARERVIYVPYYDTRIVYGPWWHSGYPPVYWPRPPYYRYSSAGIYWSTGIHISAGFFFTDFYWPHRSVVVVHAPRYYHPPHHYRGHHYYVPGHRWKHDPRHRRHVQYRHHDLQKRYRPQVHPPSAGRTDQRIERRLSQPRNYREFNRGPDGVRSAQRVRGAEPSDELRMARPPGGAQRPQTASGNVRQARVENRLRTDRADRIESRQRIERPATSTRARIGTQPRAQQASRSESRPRVQAPQRIERPVRTEHRQPTRGRQAAPAAAPPRQASPPRPARESRSSQRSRSPSHSGRQASGDRRGSTRRPY